VRDHDTYDYAVIRVVPRVEREEFINVGIVVSCPQRRFLQAAIEVDERRLTAIDPDLDIDALRKHLAIIPAICKGGEGSGPIGLLSPRERFRWLTAPRSTVVQLSPAHTGRCADPETLLEQLMNTMVRVRRSE